MGVRDSEPHTTLFFQTLPSAWGDTSCLQQEGIGDQPTGQDVGCEQLPKGNSLGPVESEAFRSRKATLLAFLLSSLKLCLGRGPSFGQEVLVTL